MCSTEQDGPCLCHCYRASNKEVDVRLSKCDSDIGEVVKVSYVGKAFVGCQERRRAVATVIAERLLGRDQRVNERIVFRDRDPLHLCRENIVVVNTSARSRYAGPQKQSTSKFKGVSWQSSRQKWYAGIRINGRATNLGRYDSERAAAAAYNKAVEALGIGVAYMNDVT